MFHFQIKAFNLYNVFGWLPTIGHFSRLNMSIRFLGCAGKPSGTNSTSDFFIYNMFILSTALDLLTEMLWTFVSVQ